MTSLATDRILYEKLDPQTGIVTFNRAEARNAMTFDMYERIAEIAKATHDDPGLRVLIFTGAGGKAFASGTDISEFRKFKSAGDAVAYEQRIAYVTDALERVGVPTIAAIDGSCVGGGFALAAACDLRIATEISRFGFPVAKGLGNCLSTKTLTSLAVLAGPARATELMMTARLIPAREAQAIGLCHEVVADRAMLEARVRDLAQTLGGYAPLTLRATKEALRRIRERLIADSEDLIRMCYGSDDFKEGVEAFLAKRPPRWKGR